MIISQVLIHIQNYIGTYIIMDCLQAFINNLLVWQNSCISKLGSLNSKYHIAQNFGGRKSDEI